MSGIMKLPKILSAIFLCHFFLIAHSQKLPNKQEVSLYAPANIKIDGNADEWENQFQAYNKATEIFYTMANDDRNLYLIAHATNPRVIQKIIYVGLTLAINTNGKKNLKDKNNISITYPLLSPKEGALIIYNARDIAYNPGTHLVANTDSTLKKATVKQIDSTIKVANTLLSTNAKEIKIDGISSIKDSLVSIYNEEGIRVGASFDITGAYTYELSIPLKYLNISGDNTQDLNYNIHIKGRSEEPKKGMLIHYYYREGHPIDADADLDSTTDFSGKYTLAKKP